TSRRGSLANDVVVGRVVVCAARGEVFGGGICSGAATSTPGPARQAGPTDMHAIASASSSSLGVCGFSSVGANAEVDSRKVSLVRIGGRFARDWADHALRKSWPDAMIRVP